LRSRKNLKALFTRNIKRRKVFNKLIPAIKKLTFSEQLIYNVNKIVSKIKSGFRYE